MSHSLRLSLGAALLPAALLPAVLLLASCGDTATGPTAGAVMTVADQVAIEATLDRVADSLKARGATSEDSLLADFVRVGARLVRMQGRAAAVSVSLPSGEAATMQAVAVRSVDRTVDPAVEARGVIAWEGLDASAFTVQRLVVAYGLVGGDGAVAFRAGDPANAARLVDLRSGTVLWYNTAGSLAFAAEGYGDSCPGITNTTDNVCATGRADATLALTLTRDAGATTAPVAWSATTLPAFELVVR